MPSIILCGIVCEKSEFLLTYSTYSATLNGFVAQVKIEVQFLNQGEETNEARFVFPVEEDSAVYSFEATIGDKHLVAKCKDREVAQKEYEKAREAGKMAILMSETSTSGDIFEYRLGNIPAKEKVTINVSMFSELTCEVDGAVRFYLPFVLNQRYGKTPKDEEYKNEPKPKEFSFNATVNWPAGIERIRPEDSSQKIKVEFKDNKRQALISLAEKLDFEKDMLFYIYYTDVSKPHVIVEKAAANGKEMFGHDVMMVNLFPQLPDFKQQVSQEYVFIVDRSGSMQGERIESAKQTLLFFLKSLPVECAFNIISFSNSYELLFPDGSKEYSEQTMAEALKFQSELYASGGTELLRAIRSLSSLKPYKGFFRQVFLMTDGEVYNTAEVVDSVKSQTKETRFFTVGIGSGASTELVKGIARAGQGKAEFVMENDNLNKKVMSLLKLSMQPVVSNVCVDAKDVTGGKDRFSFTVIPKHVPSIFSEERFILYLILEKVDKDLKSVTLNLSGKVGEARFSQDFPVDFNSKEISDMYVHRLCCRKMVQQLEEDDLGDNEGKFKDEIIRLAIAANLVSKYTSFEAECDIPQVHCQARMMYASMMPAPQMMRCKRMAFLSSPDPPEMSYCADSAQPSTFLLDQPVSPDPSIPTDSLTYLITLQTFVGSWKLNENLAKFFKVSVAKLQTQKPAISDEIWATALAVVLMRQKFSQQNNEWELLENKAVRWLKSQSLGQISLDDIFTAAGKLVPKDI